MLEYGLELWNEDPKVKEETDLRYKALTDEEREFYHNSLPLVLMAVDIGHIKDEETVDVIIARSKVLNLFDHGQINNVRAIMNKLHGYRANVNNISSGMTWLKGKKRMLQEITVTEPKVSKKKEKIA